MYKFFMVALEHSKSLEFESFLKKYIMADAEYIIAKETCQDAHKETNGQHFHVAVEIDDKSYDNFRKTVLVNYYKLRGRATKNLPRQYGIVREVRDETKFLSYTCKDKDIMTNITDKTRLNKYIDDSYKKEEKKVFETQLYEYLDNILPPFNPKEQYTSTYTLELKILQYYRENTEKLPALSTLKHLAIKYIYSRTPQTTESILNLMYNK